MKEEDKDLLIVGSIAAVVLCSAIAKAHSKSVDGIGATRRKRRVFAEIAQLQAKDIHIKDNWQDLSSDEQAVVVKLAEQAGYKQPASSTKSYGEAYYRTLQTAYSKISGIGKTDLPYSEYTIENENGDEIMRYRDYGTDDQKMAHAINWFDDPSRFSVGSDADYGYCMTVAAIASGKKFLWSGKRDKATGYQTKKGILEEVFGGTGKFDLKKRGEAERKQRISYLGSEKSGALSPEAFTHDIWRGADQYDYSSLKDGVLEAFRSVYSVKQAKKIIWEEYIAAHQLSDDYYSGLPF